MSQAQHNTNVHPIFAGVLATIQRMPEDISRASALGQYVERLKAMDWEFEHAARMQRNAGRAELDALTEMQAQIDPQAEIWNRYARFPYLITRGVKASAKLPDGTYVCQYLRTNKHSVDIANDFASKHGLPPGIKVTIEATQEAMS